MRKDKEKKIKQSNLDERQEMELSKIERNGFWFMFWGLFAVMSIEMIIEPKDLKAFAGEWLLFMIVAVYFGIQCIRKGIWDRRLKPTLKTNFIASLIAGLFVVIFMIALQYVRMEEFNLIIILLSLITGAFTVVLTFGTLQLGTLFYKNKLNKLENEQEDE